MITTKELEVMPQNTPVKVVNAYGEFDQGDIIYRKLSSMDGDVSFLFSKRLNGEGKSEWMTGDEVEWLTEESPAAVVACGTIARPVLEERKVGKIQIDLFDGGFPNAVMAVAEVMTWAAEHKGYKPHDWKNLPNPETEFSAAGSRHRVKHHIQRAENTPIAGCVDEESKLLHKAHEAFNVLAQLELMITGRIN